MAARLIFPLNLQQLSCLTARMALHTALKAAALHLSDISRQMTGMGELGKLAMIQIWTRTFVSLMQKVTMDVDYASHFTPVSGTISRWHRTCSQDRDAQPVTTKQRDHNFNWNSRLLSNRNRGELLRETTTTKDTDCGSSTEMWTTIAKGLEASPASVGKLLRRLRILPALAMDLDTAMDMTMATVGTALTTAMNGQTSAVMAGITLTAVTNGQTSAAVAGMTLTQWRMDRLRRLWLEWLDCNDKRCHRR